MLQLYTPVLLTTAFIVIALNIHDRAAMPPGLSPHVGHRLSYDAHPCTIRYVGAVDGTAGRWLGVEWDDPVRGKHDGSRHGRRYFNCM